MPGCGSRCGGNRHQGVATPPKQRLEKKSEMEKRKLEGPILPPLVKRSVTVKKILSRKTLPLHVLAESRSSPRVSNSTSTLRCSPRVSAKSGKENAEDKAVKRASGGRSKLASASFGGNSTSESSPQNKTSVSRALEDPKSNDGVFPIPVNASCALNESSIGKKVRRSYSRLELSLNRSSYSMENSIASQEDLSDSSTPNQSKPSRRSFFGFDNLLSQDVLTDVSPVTSKADVSKSRPNVGAELSVMTLHVSPRKLETNFPGIAMAKEKRKRRKVPQINKSDLDEWAAQMNAQFEEAEKFDLTVE
ncbi:sororin-B-like [Ambystoma mexicanum]|uniref:sororin-B-like n=1 Tax=Ambystoma mexicanum TaxID=8296 RepID=UPI0037E999C5